MIIQASTQWEETIMKLRYKIGTFITAAVALTIVSIISPPWHKAMATHYPQIHVKDSCTSMFLTLKGVGAYAFVPPNVETHNFDSDKINYGHTYHTYGDQTTSYNTITFPTQSTNKVACVYIYRDNKCKSYVFYSQDTNCDWHKKS